MSTDTAAQFDNECRRLVARLSLEAVQGRPISDRIMTARGLALLFPAESPAAAAAETLRAALASEEDAQLHLADLLNELS